MQISRTESDGVVIIELAGRLDAASADPVQHQLQTAIDAPAPPGRPARVLVDFTGVDYISSIGLRALIVAAKRAAAVKGKLAFCGITGPVRQVFALSGFGSIIPMVDTRNEALAALV